NLRLADRHLPGAAMSRDSGRVSVFLAIAVAGILAIIGVAVDAAGQLRTLTRAQNLAAEAARSAGQGIDGQRAMAGAAAVVEQEHLPPSVVPVDGGTAVRITVTLYYQPQILGLFGYGQIEVTATAAATLVTD